MLLQIEEANERAENAENQMAKMRKRNKIWNHLFLFYFIEIESREFRVALMNSSWKLFGDFYDSFLEVEQLLSSYI